MALKPSERSIASLNIFALPLAQYVASPFDDEDQLAAELACALHEHTPDQPLPDIEPDDFEKIYSWFLA